MQATGFKRSSNDKDDGSIYLFGEGSHEPHAGLAAMHFNGFFQSVGHIKSNVVVNDSPGLWTQ